MQNWSWKESTVSLLSSPAGSPGLPSWWRIRVTGRAERPSRSKVGEGREEEVKAEGWEPRTSG